MLRIPAQSIIFCICVLTWAAAKDEVAAVVEGLQRRYASVQSITAEFRQFYHAPGVDQVESGVMWMKKPGLMRWEYRLPEQKLFVADGRNTYLFSPEDRQVMVRPFSPEELHSTPLEFLLGHGDILKAFKVSSETDLKPKFQGALLHLQPRSPDQEYSFLVLECDAKTFDLRRIVIRERTGNTSEFEFSNISTNAKTDKKQFEFKIPKGVEVVRMDEKN